MRRSTLPAACAYATVVFFVVAPDALAATDLNTVIDNLKLWLTGLLAGLATVFLIVGGARYAMRADRSAWRRQKRDLLRRSRLRLRVVRAVIVTIIQRSSADEPPPPHAVLVATLIVVCVAGAGVARRPRQLQCRSRAARPRGRTTGPAYRLAGPASTTPTQTTTGRRQGEPSAFWICQPGQAGDWFKSLALDALDAMLDLSARPFSPPGAANPQVAGLQISLIAADALLVLLVGAGVARRQLATSTSAPDPALPSRHCHRASLSLSASYGRERLRSSAMPRRREHRLAADARPVSGWRPPHPARPRPRGRRRDPRRPHLPRTAIVVLLVVRRR
jgi:hypothetical protein